MSATHTPGPWRIKSGDPRIHSRYIVGPPEGKGKVARVVAEVYGHDENDKLLAAAPDLAEALRAILSYHSPDEIDEQPALSQARAALRKAGAL